MKAPPETCQKQENMMQFLTKAPPALAKFNAREAVEIIVGESADRKIRIPFEPVTRDNLDTYK